MQGPPLGPGQGNVLPGQENLNALQRAIDSMEEKGLQEDPRYSQLLALRANSKQNHLSQNQMQLLRAQIMAYRSLARNQPINKQIQSVISGKHRYRFSTDSLLQYFLLRRAATLCAPQMVYLCGLSLRQSRPLGEKIL